MENHSHLNAAGRSRSSQSQSPSHSAASAHCKRKLPPSSTAARNTKIKLEMSVKVETPEPGKDGGGGASAANSVGTAASAGKEDNGKSILFAENIQNSGAYIAGEETLKREINEDDIDKDHNNASARSRRASEVVYGKKYDRNVKNMGPTKSWTQNLCCGNADDATTDNVVSVSPSAVEDPPAATSPAVASPPTTARPPRRSTSRARRSIGRKKEMVIDPLLTHEVAGGPLIPELLYGFEGHVAYAISKGHERPLLKVHQRRKQLLEWDLVDDEEWSNLAKDTGLTHLQTSMYDQHNIALINAFVERWQPETNTFHMSFGEMTITLHDAHYLLGLNINGGVLVGQREATEVYQDLVAELKMTEKEIEREEVSRRGFRCLWLIARATDEKLRNKKTQTVATCYLLYLLYSTLFTDKSQDRLSISLLPVLEDYDRLRGFSWGSAAISYMYRRLGEATRTECKQICGCITLLESWIYAYFPTLRPVTNREWDSDAEPWALKWKSTKLPNPIPNYRKILDNMESKNVDWMPYGPLDFSGPLAPSTFHGLIHFLDKYEPYMPDRVARQFGRQQRIPSDPIKPLVALRPEDFKKYKVEYESSRWTWDSRNFHLMTMDQIGAPARFSGDCVDNYFAWYEARSHLFVQPAAFGHPPQGPIDLESRMQRALGEITPWLTTDSMSAQVPPDLYQSLQNAAFELGYQYPRHSQYDMGGSSHDAGPDS